MNSDPQKAGLLEYLILLVSDWRKDTKSLVAAMTQLPTRASLIRNPTVPNPPRPPEMSSSPEDYEWCAAYFQVISYNNYATALGVLDLNQDPNKSDLARSLGFDDVNSIDATNEWMKLISGLFKSMIRFYPIASLPDPLPPPPAQPNGDEGTFWSSLKNELQLQAQVLVDFVNDHFSGKAMVMPQQGSARPRSKTICILSIEQSAHQVFMDYCRIANHLPDHFSRLSAGSYTILKTK